MGHASGNGTEAARQAGYAASSAHVTACRLLRKANVQAEIAKAREALEQPAIADAAERRQILTTIARRAWNATDQARAIDVLNKMDGLYVQKHEHKGTVTLEHILGEAAQ